MPRRLRAYAALCQEANIVPIVEPEVLMDGKHSLPHCYEVSEAVLRAVFTALYEHRVFLEGIVLKPNMVVPGAKSGHLASPEEVATATVRLFKNSVPVAVPALRSFPAASRILRPPPISTRLVRAAPPWPVTFSYGRALTGRAAKGLVGQAGQCRGGAGGFHHRAYMNSLAARGPMVGNRWRKPRPEHRTEKCEAVFG